MATKSLGHLGVATGDIGSSTSAIDMSTILGLPVAADFSQFDCVTASTLSSSNNPMAVEENTTIACTYSSQGSRHATHIAPLNANYAFDEDSGGRSLELSGQSGDDITGTALDTGSILVWCDYNDGGYNNTGYLEVTQEIS